MSGSKRFHVWVFAASLAIAVAFSIQVRWQQRAVWQRQPERYFVAGQPLMTSMDAYHWIRLAENHRDPHLSPGERDTLRCFPDGAEKKRFLPLLSLLIVLTSYALGVDAYEAGVLLIPVLASLFIVPLALYFWKIGLPAAGLLGGMVATVSHEYLSRTSMGGVDTDALNLLFPLLGSLCILCAQGTDRRVRLFSGMAGLSMLAFHWWYAHPGFIPVYLALLIAWLFVNRVHWKTILGAAAIYVLVSNPLHLLAGLGGAVDFISSYVFAPAAVHVSDSFSLPSTLATVAEAQRDPPMKALAAVLNPPWLALLGLLLFAVCAVRRFKQILPLLPLAILGLLTFQGRRFAMFAGPLVGIGYGYLVAMALGRLLDRARVRDLHRTSAVYAATFLVFLALLLCGSTSIGFVPQPTLSSATVWTIHRLKERLPPHAVVLSWWDYGYALAGLGRFAVYHDGSSQTVNTYLIARALSARNQDEIYATVNFINAMGSERIEQMLEESTAPSRILAQASHHPGSVDRDDIHVLLLEDMVRKFAAIFSLGTWDMATGSGSVGGYQKLECSKWEQQKIHCKDMVIDTRTGEIRRDLSLERLILIRNGRQTEQKTFPRKTGVYLQVLAGDSGVTDFYLLNEPAFTSNFNQMFFLGKFDPSLYEEIHDGFPVARVLRLKRRASP